MVVHYEVTSYISDVQRTYLFTRTRHLALPPALLYLRTAWCYTDVFIIIMFLTLLSLLAISTQTHSIKLLITCGFFFFAISSESFLVWGIFLLGMTAADLVGTWRREAEKALGLRTSGDLQIDLYKVVGQREVGCCCYRARFTKYLTIIVRSTYDSDLRHAQE